MKKLAFKRRAGDRINAAMSAVGHGPRLILKWPRILLRLIIAAIVSAIAPVSAFRWAS